MQDKFPLSMRLIHWVMALLILVMIYFGWWMAGLPKETPDRMWFYDMHKSLGVTALLLLIVRFAVRMSSQIPSLPSGLAASEKVLAKLAHVLLYVLMLAVPVSGLVMSGAAGYGVKFFGLPLPNPLATDKELAGLAHFVHGYLPYILLGVVALHAAGALKHRFFDKKNDVLHKML